MDESTFSARVGQVAEDADTAKLIGDEAKRLSRPDNFDDSSAVQGMVKEPAKQHSIHRR
ncbi:hypothetical protein [Phenylobacterium sp.]|uniref:hypothetical protein n=1 Tax=Phenylobacterium sp. TaxID=1871053 RepID=UPI00273256C4|nr:hypothetical protein [Phenylobacterium sp.]MDP3854068.1 hypothetical protein [Phenylobacterium sp.]